MHQLMFQTPPTVTLATNRFTNVPVIFQYDDTPMISLFREEQLGFTSDIRIYHSDGTYLAKARGTRIFRTQSGKNAGIVIRSLPAATVCELDGKTAFEITHQPGNAFKTSAELYTPNGYFVKTSDAPAPQLFDASNKELQVGGIHMANSEIKGSRIGIWLKSSGWAAIGCN